MSDSFYAPDEIARLQSLARLNQLKYRGIPSNANNETPLKELEEEVKRMNAIDEFDRLQSLARLNLLTPDEIARLQFLGQLKQLKYHASDNVDRLKLLARLEQLKCRRIPSNANNETPLEELEEEVKRMNAIDEEMKEQERKIPDLDPQQKMALETFMTVAAVSNCRTQ